MGHKILLADDSITIQKVIELTFSDEDFELHTVGNGQKAIDEIRSIMPHIVLCDIIMPEKNGYEVCEFIKTSADLKHIPVLLLTGAFEPFDQERARSAGCDGFLAKPFEPQTLISKVKELLARAPVASAPKAFVAQPMEVADERTITMPPAAASAATPPAPPRDPQVAAPAPPPPPPPAAEYGAGLDDAFAIEAGERELLMEPGDHTVLLGGRETQSAAPPTGGDDIWGEVASPVNPEEEDSSTVFMAPPPLASSPAAPPYSSQDYEMQYDAADLDSTWRMPSSESGEPDPAYSGFEEFVEPASPAPPAPPAYAPPPIPEPPAREAPPMDIQPPRAPAPPEPAEAVSNPFEPYDPFVASATSGAGFEPASPFDTDATLDPAIVANESRFERIPDAFESYGEPEIVAESEVERLVEPPPPVYEPAAAASAEPFNEIDASAPSISEVSEMEEPPSYEAPPSPSPAPSMPSTTSIIDDAIIERVAERVMEKLSAKIIQEIAWEVVPDLAEGLIQREIESLKAKLAKVPK